MISFIIIGRNEEKNLPRCINSINAEAVNFAAYGYEIIYVDSNSSDKSVEIALSYQTVRIFKITGQSNAAVGRNIGALNAHGDILFFMDGDMELRPGIINKFISIDGKLIYPFMSGNFENHYYSLTGTFINKGLYYEKLVKDTYMPVTGGLFLIERQLFQKIEGMRTRFFTGEDLDLGLRLAKSGVLQLRKPDILVNHHTVHYKSFRRIWQDLFQGRSLYARGVLYRHHLLNRYMYPKMIKSDPTAMFLFFTGVIGIIFWPWLILLYFIFLFAVLLLFVKFKGITDFFNRYFNQLVRDIMTIFAFLFFYPSDIKVDYQKIN